MVGRWNKSSWKEKSTWLNLLKIICIALPTTIFGVFTVIFSLQQNNFARLIRGQDQRQVDEDNLRTSFQDYLNDISILLLRKDFNRNNSEHLLYIRIRTLAALRFLDRNRKHDVILFLYESQLLRSDTVRLDLTGVDLSYVEFVGSSSSPLLLDSLYLFGIKGRDIVFHWCQLNHAIFDYSSIPNVKFVNVGISNSSFRKMFAPNLTMYNTLSLQNNFSGAIIPRMNYISEVDVLTTIDFTNADLIDSILIFDGIKLDFNLYLIHPSINIINARLPNGSFILINTANLIEDGGAEQGCQSKENNRLWIQNGNLPMMELFDMRNNCSMINIYNKSDCYFLSRSSGESSLLQQINLESYSVLIDNNQAMFNLSAYFHCQAHQYINVSIIATFLSYYGIPIEQDSMSAKMNSSGTFIELENIPPSSRLVRVSLHSYSIDPTGFCIIDDVQFRIFQRPKK